MEPKNRHYLVSIIIECDPETHLQALDDLNVSFEDEPGVLGSIVTNILPVIGVTESQKKAFIRKAARRMSNLVPVGGDHA